MLDGGRKAGIEGSTDAEARSHVLSLADVRRDAYQSNCFGSAIGDLHTDQASRCHLSGKYLVRPLFRNLSQGSESRRTAALYRQARNAGGEWLYGRIAVQQSECR